MPRIYSRDNGFEDMMNTMGPTYVPVQQKFNKKTGQYVQRMGAVNATPLTYSEDDYMEIAGLLYYAGKITEFQIRTNLQVKDKAGVIQRHPQEDELVEEILAVDTAVNNNKLKNYAKNAFQSNDNLAFIEGVSGNGNISLKSVCADLKQNFSEFARHFHDANDNVVITWGNNLIHNTLDSMQLQFLTPAFIEYILVAIMKICKGRRSFQTQDLEDGKRRKRSKRSKRSKSKSADGKRRRSKRSKKSRSKSVDGKKRRSNKSRSKRSKKSKKSKKSKSVDGKRRSKKSRSKRSKKSRSKSADGKRHRSKKSKRSRRHRRHSAVDGRKRRSKSKSRSRKSRSRSMSAKKLLKLLRKM
jgi:hypothetical protein